ncbi:MAG: RDD family protein [Planctomycetes bacterium]|nr:RDD family protein [Planctomycetota bacterium]
MNRNEEDAAVVLTPEHVPIRLNPAGLGTRFWATLLDAFIVMLVVTVLGGALMAVLPGAISASVMMVFAFVLKWGYDMYFEVRRQGQTPGKRLCGLRVVDRRGLPITFQQAFVRNIVRVLDFAPVFYGLGALVALCDRYGRRLGDIAAETLVVQERAARRDLETLSQERRFNSLREPRVLRRVRRLIGLEEREFLLALCARADRLKPEARFDLMEDVGSHYGRLLGIEEAGLSAENLVRGLLAVLYSESL